ncbi:DUF305 domain-containing protein [Yinghuangia aomiensis]|uniref:DUF305 domain-containing protein n=1 Tax=Yinghuangia aomiensis TaxID=676205 RepID=A0ABP9I6S5_9ACTN
MKRRMPRVLALSAVALSAALVLAACGSDGGDDGMNTGDQPTSPAASSAAPQSAAGFNDTDVMFAQMMIPHHEQAVDMAKAVLAKSANADVKKLATAIEAAQAPEIARMKGWLAAWGKPAAMPSTGGTGGMSGMDHGTGADGMMSDADMRKFRAAAGTELDTLFLQMMIVHHNGAITMAEDELAKGVNADARKLAEAVKTSQSAEVQQMQKLLGSAPGAQPATSATPSVPGMTGMPGHGM